jgi:multicomponent Na+:H+ antiporter subunit D
LPYPVDYEPYTATHVLTQCQLLFFSALAFCWLKLSGLYPPELPGVNIDAEWLYRKAFPLLARRLTGAFGTIRLGAISRAHRGTMRLMREIYRHHGPTGILARTWPTGSMAFWATFLLAAYLVLYYF